MSDETRDFDVPRCPQCGRELDGATRTSDGLAICPQCAHSVAPWDRDDRSTEMYLPDEVLQTTGEERFRLSGRLGEGGFGTVYRAFDRSLRRHVAIKVPKKSVREFDSRQFILEARAASALRHPNVVTVFDVGFNEGAPYIVSECIEGVSLRQWLDGPQANFDAVAAICEKLCRAIGYAHAMGVVHRDIKPSNVVVDDAGEPHILDFGLSNSRVTGEAVRFRRDVPVGTPAYMAPEQANGDLDAIGPPTDIYALGVVLYQMLTRRLPFVGSSERILDLVVNEEPVRPRIVESRVPAPLEAIALKAMRKPVDERYSSADAMAEDLARYRRGEPVKALGRYDKRSLVMTARRRFMGGVAATATCGLVGSTLFWGYLRRQDDPRVRVRLDGNSGDDTVTWEPLDRQTLSPTGLAVEVAGGGDVVRLAPGLYRVTVARGSDSVEAFRTVPAVDRGDGRLVSGSGIGVGGVAVRLKWQEANGRDVAVLPGVEVVPLSAIAGGMRRFEGGEVEYENGLDRTANGLKIVPGFYLQRTPATVGDVVAEFGAPIFNATRKLTDEAQLPFPVAVELAERRGTALMTAWEWLYAATNGGRTRFPWGDEYPEGTPWNQLASLDRCRDYPNVSGLYSGLGEWTETEVPTPAAYGGAPMSRSGTPSLRLRAIAGCPAEALGGTAGPILPPRSAMLFARAETYDAQPVSVRGVRRGSKSS